MTENEAIEVLKENHSAAQTRMLEYAVKSPGYSRVQLRDCEAFDMAIKALEEVQKYQKYQEVGMADKYLESMMQQLPINAPEECGVNKLLKGKNLEKPRIEGEECEGLYTEDDSGKRELWPVCSECQHHLQQERKVQMGKAVLVIDMPESCSECKFSYEFQGIKKCNLLNALCNGGKAIIPKDKYAECRHDGCPLVELPEEDKKDHYPDVYRSGYTQGWNDCRGEILGDEF